MEESFSRRNRHHGCAFSAPARLPKDQHARWIAAKLGNIVTYPLERKNQVKLAGIARLGIFRREIAKIHVAEGIEPVIDRDDYYIAAENKLTDRLLGRHPPAAKPSAAA